MSEIIKGLALNCGVIIGRAVLSNYSRSNISHHFIKQDEIDIEINSLNTAKDAAVAELKQLQKDICEQPDNINMPMSDMPQELSAMIDVHLMLLQDEMMLSETQQWIKEKSYNAAWALFSQFEVIARQFDEVQDEYLRDRKADIEQVIERILRHLDDDNQNKINTINNIESKDQSLILIAHDLSPADLISFRKKIFKGFATDIGGKNSHTAILAKSMQIPAVVAAKSLISKVRPDDLIIIDSNNGQVYINPEREIIEKYEKIEKQQNQTNKIIDKSPAITKDGQEISLWINIEQPQDADIAINMNVRGIGLFRSEYLFMGRSNNLPDEEEQLAAYKLAIETMKGRCTTIRTIDIGADKPLDEKVINKHTNPALGLRAVRWSLSQPKMFLTQVRAILKAAKYGSVRILIPMLGSLFEVTQTLKLINQAKQELENQGYQIPRVPIGAMIEVPAAALMPDIFFKYFDFLSIGTNDLIQYTLAVDRTDEEVAHLYDPLNPAVLRLIANTIKEGKKWGKPVSICGEMAGDEQMTQLLLGMGLKEFSMSAGQIAKVKEKIRQSDAGELINWAEKIVQSVNPYELIQTNKLS